MSTHQLNKSARKMNCLVGAKLCGLNKSQKNNKLNCPSLWVGAQRKMQTEEDEEENKEKKMEETKRKRQREQRKEDRMREENQTK